MLITLEKLKELKACKEGITFAVHAGLIGLDYNDLDIEGDYSEYVMWLEENIDSKPEHVAKPEYEFIAADFKTTDPSDPRIEVTKKSDDCWQEYTSDEKGSVLTFKNSYGMDWIYTYDQHGKELTSKESKGYWEEYTRDDEGRPLTYKDSDGDWKEWSYDQHGNELTYKDSDGDWKEWSYDQHGNELIFKNSDGYVTEWVRDSKGRPLAYKDNRDTDEVFEYGNGYLIRIFDEGELTLSIKLK